MLFLNVLLIRYGELTLKSKGIRAFYETTLVNQIKYLLGIHKISYSKIKRELGRLFIYFEIEQEQEIHKTKQILLHIFGIYSISVCISCSSNVDDILNLCSQIGKEMIFENETYGIKIKKACSIRYTSQDLAKLCGDSIWNSLEEKKIHPKVNLKNPTKLINIELREKESYIYFEKIQCLGGFPVGTQGKMIVLLSGGIDSPVAAWLMMKRGVDIVPIYFDNGKYGNEKILEKAKENAIKLFSYSPKKTHYFYHVSHEKYMDLIIKYCSPKNRCILCKHSMFVISNEIRKNLNIEGIVTGSSLGQVASQTLKNMNAELYNLSIPIYHPLIGFDKQEIINLAKRIGTYDTSIKQINDVDCKAVPKKPEIQAIKDIVFLEENKIDSILLEETKQEMINNQSLIRYDFNEVFLHKNIEIINQIQ